MDMYTLTCECGRPATRRVIPFLDVSDATFAVCDDDSHIPVDPRDISEIEEVV